MEQPNFDLTGAVVVITGASRGIGRGLAGILARSGATVVVAARDVADVASLVDDLTKEGCRVQSRWMSGTCQPFTHRLVLSCVSTGRIDCDSPSRTPIMGGGHGDLFSE